MTLRHPVWKETWQVSEMRKEIWHISEGWKETWEIWKETSLWDMKKTWHVSEIWKESWHAKRPERYDKRLWEIWKEISLKCLFIPTYLSSLYSYLYISLLIPIYLPTHTYISPYSYLYISLLIPIYLPTHTCISLKGTWHYIGTANPTWGDIFK